MLNQSKKYQQFLDTLEEYREERKKILRGPEENLHQLAKKFDIHALRNEICEHVEKLSKETWRLYRKIYAHESSMKQVEKFLSNVEELLTYEEIVSPSQRDSWKGLYNLVKAYKETKSSKTMTPVP